MNSEEAKEEHFKSSGEPDRKVTTLCKELKETKEEGSEQLSCSFSPLLCVFQEFQRLLHICVWSWGNPIPLGRKGGCPKACPVYMEGITF